MVIYNGREGGMAKDRNINGGRDGGREGGIE